MKRMERESRLGSNFPNKKIILSARGELREMIEKSL